MRNLILYILFLSTTLCQAQNGDNPFDIKREKERLGDESITMTTASQAQNNVFDIKRTTQTENSHLNTSDVSQETETLIVDTEETKSKQEVEELSPAKSPKENLSKNPFEVSHIPIRKSKLKEDANALKAAKKTNTPATSDAFIFWLILLSAVLIAVVINTKKSVIPKIMKSLTNINVLTYNKREEKGGFSGQYLMLYVMFFLNGGIFLYLLLKEYTNISGSRMFIYCISAVTGLYLTKHILLRIFGFIFPVQKDISVFSFSIQVYNITLGLILIPINLLVAFGPAQMLKPILYIGVGAVALLFVMRSLRGLLFGVKYIQQHAFHFFLYLCSSEIVPILLFIKLI